MQQQHPVGRVVSGAARNLKLIAQTPDVRIVEYTLEPGDSHPWHRHSQVTDRIYCLEGLIGVDSREPERQFLLQPGQSCEVPVGTVHHVSNPGGDTGRYLLVQALGKYDYIRAE
ncbi:MAG TPA: cupin domain-containing protein [Stellaceae bacterium]|nr:cupin domain-containing protein [Stellaceae bacterium]